MWEWSWKRVLNCGCSSAAQSFKLPLSLLSALTCSRRRTASSTRHSHAMMGVGQGAVISVRTAVGIRPASCSRWFVIRIKRMRVVAAPAHLLPPLPPKPNSGHRTALGAKRANTPCFGRHPGFKFIHEWRGRSAHRTDTAKTKTQSKSKSKKCGGMRGGWGLGAGGRHPVPRSKASRVVPICR